MSPPARPEHFRILCLSVWAAVLDGLADPEHFIEVNAEHLIDILTSDTFDDELAVQLFQQFVSQQELPKTRTVNCFDPCLSTVIRLAPWSMRLMRISLALPCSMTILSPGITLTSAGVS